MHDAWPQVAFLVAELGEARQQPVDQRPALVARRRVDDDAANSLSITIIDGSSKTTSKATSSAGGRSIWREIAEITRGRRRRLAAGLARLSVQPDGFDADQALPLGARAVWLATVALQEAVEAIARRKRRNRHNPAARRFPLDGMWQRTNVISRLHLRLAPTLGYSWRQSVHREECDADHDRRIGNVEHGHEFDR